MAKKCPEGGEMPGCGSVEVSEPDEEGFRDCSACGLFYKDNETDLLARSGLSAATSSGILTA